MSLPKEYKILIAIAVGAIVLGFLLFYFGDSNSSKTVPLVDRADAFYKGNKDAKVVINEFSDFQCPACRAAESTINKIMLSYPEKIKFVFRHFPLDNHSLSRVAAEAVEAAGNQGKFWEMHDMLYDRQNEWGDFSKKLSEQQALEIFKNYAKELNLDVEKFYSDVSNKAHNSIINKDYNDGLASGVKATPTFFVNGQAIKAPTYEAIKQAIDAALK